MDLWLNPGALLSVNSLTKVTMIQAAPGETPPPGATVIPPMTPMAAMAHQAMRAAMAANTEVAVNAAVAAQEAQEETSAATAPHPPWEVTFREKQ